MQRRTYPFAFVILSPGSKIGHTPRKNPSAPMGAAATSRINAYRGWCRTPILHQPFAAKKYDTTIYRKLQVFFQQIVKYFLKNSAFCRNSLSRPFPAFPLWGYHLLPWYIIHVPAQKARVVSRIFCLAWCIFCSLGVVGIFGEEMSSFGAVRVSRERNSLYQGMFMAIPHNSKCRYGERCAADAKPKAQIILDAAKVSAASGENSEPKQGQRSQSARAFAPEARCGYRNPTLSSILATQMPCRSRRSGA